MTRKLTLAILAATAIAAAPAQAGQGGGKQEGGGEHHGAAGRCATHTVGFNASGTLVAQALAPAADGRWSGMLTVDVKRANHGAPTGNQAYTLDGARIRSGGTPRPGDRVKLHGKLTRVPAGCGSAASMEVDVRWITMKAAS